MAVTGVVMNPGELALNIRIKARELDALISEAKKQGMVVKYPFNAQVNPVSCVHPGDYGFYSYEMKITRTTCEEWN